MENKILSGKDISRSCCIIIQTCDAYQKYWDSLFWSFNKYWDESIPFPICFCNEELDVKITKPNVFQLKTGSGSHSARMSLILDKLEKFDYVFYMLEDFWLTDQMTNEMFSGLFKIMTKNNWDCLRIAPYMPNYYSLEATNHVFKNRRILKYASESRWKFSQQASFWKRDFLKKCIVEPIVSETRISSSLSGEIAMDEYLRENYPKAEIYHYHYHWYPVSGSVWRGELTQIGEQIEFMRKVDRILYETYEKSSSK